MNVRRRRQNLHAPRCGAARLSRRRSGFSLLEVILALIILTMSVVTVGEAVRAGVRCAMEARDLTQAEMLCESKLAEIAAGVLPPDPVFQVPIQANMLTTAESIPDPNEQWTYSVDSMPMATGGLLAVTVTVEQSIAAARRPVSCSLSRWVRDPLYVPPVDSSGAAP